MEDWILCWSILNLVTDLIEALGIGDSLHNVPILAVNSVVHGVRTYLLELFDQVILMLTNVPEDVFLVRVFIDHRLVVGERLRNWAREHKSIIVKRKVELEWLLVGMLRRLLAEGDAGRKPSRTPPVDILAHAGVAHFDV